MATEGISSSTPISAPPRPSAAERNRAEDVRAEQERVQQDEAAAQQAQQARQREPVVNTQGQTTGRIVNETA
jgi:hypothetical protein